MKEFEALSQMLISMMNYVGITEGTYDEATIKKVKELLNDVSGSDLLSKAIQKAFKDTFQEDYRKLLTITLRAITEALQGLNKELEEL